MKKLAAAVVVLGSLLVCGVSGAVTVGQLDNFEDGTTQGWTSALLGAANPTPPANVSTGGPAGADDNFLRLSSVGGAGAGSRLVGINPSQWGGDYTANGVAWIAMDVNNFGASDLYLRLLFEDPTVGPPSNTAFSTDAILLRAGSGWNSVMFPILRTDLTAGLGSVADALANATVLRIFSSSAAAFPGEAIVASLGVDNICAIGADGNTENCAGGGTSVPEPGSLALLGLGLAALRYTRRCAPG